MKKAPLTIACLFLLFSCNKKTEDIIEDKTEDKRVDLKITKPENNA
ncbi:MAG: hypothetical protein WC716_11660 [Chitinophagaceae bacterium]|jgi:hypothetical protein